MARQRELSPPGHPPPEPGAVLAAGQSAETALMRGGGNGSNLRSYRQKASWRASIAWETYRYTVLVSQNDTSIAVDERKQEEKMPKYRGPSTAGRPCNAPALAVVHHATSNRHVVSDSRQRARRPFSLRAANITCCFATELPQTPLFHRKITAAPPGRRPPRHIPRLLGRSLPTTSPSLSPPLSSSL